MQAGLDLIAIVIDKVRQGAQQGSPLLFSVKKRSIREFIISIILQLERMIFYQYVKDT
jgi:hypothetical protein